MRYLKYLWIFLVFTSYGCSSKTTSSDPAILHYAKAELPHYGILKISEGFIYVDLDDDYIHKLVSFIQKEGFQEPPYFGSSDLVGAHISVAYPEEAEKYGIENLEEYGEKIPFTLKECQIAHPTKLQGIEQVYFIVIEAPELDRIRKKYGLPKKQYDFHITIGAKPKVEKSA